MACYTLLCLSACSAIQQPQPDSQTWAAHRAQLAQLEGWTTSGKVALRSPQQAESGSLLWRQQGQVTHIELSGPLGFNSTTIDSDGQQLEIRQGDDYSRWQLDDPRLQENDGWHLPLRALHYWLKGIPAPQWPLESLVLDAGGHLPSELRQRGWTVQYQGYRQFDSFTLPTRLSLQQGDTSARIILRQWGDFSAP
jgi:outer membrane lipoprotein LolB